MELLGRELGTHWADFGIRVPLRLGGSRPPQKRSSSSSRHKLSANQHPPHWRGRHNRSSFSRNRTIEASGSNPSQRSSGNSDSVRGCSAPSPREITLLFTTPLCRRLWPPAPISISYLCRENSGAPEPIGQVRLALKV